MSPEARSLLDRNILVIDGGIDSEMFNYIKDCLRYLISKDSPDIEVRITSNGGRVDRGLDIYDAICLYPGKKTGIVLGLAASMGAIILQACDVRKITPHARILIHYVSRGDMSLSVLTDKDKLDEVIQKMKQSQKYLEEILVEKTGKDLEVIQAECLKDTEMTASEALKFGIVDEIIDFKKENKKTS